MVPELFRLPIISLWRLNMVVCGFGGIGSLLSVQIMSIQLFIVFLYDPFNAFGICSDSLCFISYIGDLCLLAFWSLSVLLDVYRFDRFLKITFFCVINFFCIVVLFFISLVSALVFIISLLCFIQVYFAPLVLISCFYPSLCSSFLSKVPGICYHLFSI